MRNVAALLLMVCWCCVSIDAVVAFNHSNFFSKAHPNVEHVDTLRNLNIIQMQQFNRLYSIARTRFLRRHRRRGGDDNLVMHTLPPLISHAFVNALIVASWHRIFVSINGTGSSAANAFARARAVGIERFRRDSSGFRLVAVHQMKAAGTSFCQMARVHSQIRVNPNGNENCLLPHQCYDLRTMSSSCREYPQTDIVASTDAFLDMFRLQNFTFAQIEQQLPWQVLPSPAELVYVLLTRHPFTRYLSYWAMHKRWDHTAINRFSVADFWREAYDDGFRRRNSINALTRLLSGLCLGAHDDCTNAAALQYAYFRLHYFSDVLCPRSIGEDFDRLLRTLLLRARAQQQRIRNRGTYPSWTRRIMSSANYSDWKVRNRADLFLFAQAQRTRSDGQCLDEFLFDSVTKFKL